MMPFVSALSESLLSTMPLALAALTVSCTNPPTRAKAPAPPPPTFTAGVAVERWFPLVNGHLYQYVTQTDGGGEGVMVIHAERSDATTGALRLPTQTRTFRYVPDGVQQLTDNGYAYVLKTPVAVGRSWRGKSGGQVTITDADAAVQVPAGAFTGCVVTREARAGDAPLVITTSFCPEVGIVLLDAAAGGHHERAALRSYGPPIDLGRDGVRQLPVPR